MQVVRRVGLIGEVQCEDEALELRELGRHDVEVVLRAGDVATARMTAARLPFATPLSKWHSAPWD